VWSKKHDPETFEYPWPVEKDWTLPELYALERFYLGESFVCGKADAYVGFFRKNSVSFREIKQMHDREPIHSIRAEIKSIFEFKVKKETSKFLGEHMIKATIEDEFGDLITLTIFPNKWKEVKSRIRDLCGSKYKFEPGLAINFSGTVNIYEDEVGIVLENFFDFCPPPNTPKDLKAKKVSTRKSSNNHEAIIDINVSNTDELIEIFEDELFDEGLIDLNEEADD
jgi:hypothetical protein